MSFCPNGKCTNGGNVTDKDDPNTSSDLEHEEEDDEEEEAAAFPCPQVLSCPEFEFSVILKRMFTKFQFCLSYIVFFKISDRIIFFSFQNSACYICNGYYGPCFGEPVCATCHAFLFPDDAGLLQAPLFSEVSYDLLT